MMRWFFLFTFRFHHFHFTIRVNITRNKKWIKKIIGQFVPQETRMLQTKRKMCLVQRNLSSKVKIKNYANSEWYELWTTSKSLGGALLAWNFKLDIQIPISAPRELAMFSSWSLLVASSQNRSRRYSLVACCNASVRASWKQKSRLVFHDPCPTLAIIASCYLTHPQMWHFRNLSVWQIPFERTFGAYSLTKFNFPTAGSPAYFCK